MGAKLKFHNADTEIMFATIEVLNPQREFTLRWDRLEPSGALLMTSFLLAEENGGTRVTIREWAEKAGEGYTMSMENLKALLEGRELPHQ